MIKKGELHGRISLNAMFSDKYGLEVIEAFSSSTELSKKFILLINVWMLTIVDILIFIYRITVISECFKARKIE